MIQAEKNDGWNLFLSPYELGNPGKNNPELNVKILEENRFSEVLFPFGIAFCMEASLEKNQWFLGLLLVFAFELFLLDISMRS